MSWNVYLAGEIHSDWRERIAQGTKHAGLEVIFTSPVTDHAASDDVGVAILGEENTGFWKDHKGAGVNAIRTQTLIRQADVVLPLLARLPGPRASSFPPTIWRR
jgi:YtoQ family protein